MTIAVINHKKLFDHLTNIGFPINHRIDLTPAGLGYKVFNDYIQDNVEWIQQLAFNKKQHIKLWTSSKVTGPVPTPENYYHRGVIGTEDSAPECFFKDVDNLTYINYLKTTQLLGEEYIVDYVTCENGEVAVEKYLRVIVTDNADDSYLGYGLSVPVERLWLIHYMTDGANKFWVARSEFPIPDGEPELFYVRAITSTDERDKYYECKDGLWVKRNKELTTIQDVPVNMTELDESLNTVALLTSTDLKVEMTAANKNATIKEKLGL